MQGKGIQDLIGAHLVKGRSDFERRRARGRVLHSLVALVLIGATGPWRDGAFGSLWTAPLLAVAYAALGIAQFIGLKRHPDGWVKAQYFTMCLDPAAFAVLLCDAPSVTAFLAPYAIFMSVPVGLRYGPRAFGFAWAGMMLTVVPVLYWGNPFWQQQPQLMLALLFMALLPAACFGPLRRELYDRHLQDIDENRAQALEAAMVAKSAFLARVSHQLRSPLQAIVSALELMESPSQQAMRHKLAGNISASATKLSLELRDLLTIARAEAWQLHLEPSTFDAGMLLDSVAAEILSHPDYRGQRVMKVVPQEPLFLVADSDKIVQVLASVSRHVLGTLRSESLTLVMKTHEPGSGCVTFVVSGDTAEPPALEADAGDVKKHRDDLNDSLSLTLVRTLVDFLGGSLDTGAPSAASREFHVTIPCEVVAEDGHPEKETASPQVLVVAENTPAPGIVVALARQFPSGLEFASSWPVAANRLASRKFALVLVDMNLPRRSGMRLAMAMKNGHAASRDTWIVSFNARPAPEGSGTVWPFDAVIAGAPSQARLAAAISSLQPGKSLH